MKYMWAGGGVSMTYLLVCTLLSTYYVRHTLLLVAGGNSFRNQTARLARSQFRPSSAE